MITTLQRYFLKHGRLLFGSLLAIVIVAFVFTFGPSGGLGRDEGMQIAERNYFGHDLNSALANQERARDAQLSFYLFNGTTPRSAEQLQQYVYNRLAAIAQADRLGIPAPTEAELAEFLQSRPALQNPQGEFDPAAYNRFRTIFAQNMMFSEERIAAVVAQDYRMERYRQALGGGGFIVPRAAEMQFLERNRSYTAERATIAYAEFSPQIEPTEEELRAFYEENPARFEIPEKVRVSALHFYDTEFMEEARESLTEEGIQAYYEANSERYRDINIEGMVTREAPPLEMIRDEVVEDFANERAVRLAQEAADVFTYTLFRQEVRFGTDRFLRLYDESGGVLTTLPEFSEAQPSPVAGFTIDQLRSAFELDREKYFSDVIIRDNGASVLLLRERVPPRVPPFEEVQSEVETAYVGQERRRLFSEQGATWREEIEQALADGESFAAAVAERGFSHTAFPAFTLQDGPPEGLDFDQAQLIIDLDEGEVSNMRSTRNQGQFFYLAAVEEPTLEDNAEAIAEVRAQIEENLANAAGDAVIAQLAEAELRRTFPEEQQNAANLNP